jgi:hypothetical protein
LFEEQLRESEKLSDDGVEQEDDDREDSRFDGSAGQTRSRKKLKKNFEVAVSISLDSYTAV